MQIKTVNRLSRSALMVGATVIVACLMTVFHYYDRQSQYTQDIQALERQHDLIQQALSDTVRLTQAFVATRNESYRQAYFDVQRIHRPVEQAMAFLKGQEVAQVFATDLQHLRRSIDELMGLSQLAISPQAPDQDFAEDEAMAALADESGAGRIIFSRKYDDAYARAVQAAKTYKQTTQEYLRLACEQAVDMAMLILLFLGGTLVCCLAVVAWVLTVYYRRSVLVPLDDLCADLAAQNSDAMGQLRHLSLNNEIGELARRISKSHQALGEMEILRRIKTAVSQIMLSAHQAQSLPGIAHALSSNLSKALNHSVVAVHLRPHQNGPLRLYGDHAEPNAFDYSLGHRVREVARTSRDKDIPPGMVAQCADDKTILQLHGLPDTYLKLRSGVGETRPRFLTLAPIVYDSHTLGVIEIASRAELQSSCLQLLTDVCTAMGMLLDREIPLAAAREETSPIRPSPSSLDTMESRPS